MNAEYPKPGFTIVADEMTPFVIVAVAVAVVPIPTPIRGGALIFREAVPL